MGPGTAESALMDIWNLVINAIGVILIPCVIALFTWINSLSKEISKIELHIAREYVSMANMREVMAPIQKDVRDLERLMLRIADKLHVPAISDD